MNIISTAFLSSSITLFKLELLFLIMEQAITFLFMVKFLKNYNYLVVPHALPMSVFNGKKIYGTFYYESMLV